MKYRYILIIQISKITFKDIILEDITFSDGNDLIKLLKDLGKENFEIQDKELEQQTAILLCRRAPPSQLFVFVGKLVIRLSPAGFGGQQQKKGGKFCTG